MPVGRSLSVAELVDFGLFERAVERYRSQRRTTVELTERADELVRGLDDKRRELDLAVHRREEDLKRLMDEVDRLSEAASDHFNRLADLLDGGDEDWGEPGLDSANALINGLRRAVTDRVALVVVRGVPGDDDPDR